MKALKEVDKLEEGAGNDALVQFCRRERKAIETFLQTPGGDSSS